MIEGEEMKRKGQREQNRENRWDAKKKLNFKVSEEIWYKKNTRTKPNQCLQVESILVKDFENNVNNTRLKNAGKKQTNFPYKLQQLIDKIDKNQ